MTVCIIGLGLIGGSMALDLKRRGLAKRIIGVEKRVAHAQKAMELGIADTILPMKEAVEQADVIVLAVPVDAALKRLPRILDRVTRQTVIDVCSTKHSLCQSVSRHPARGRYVPAHPMAGTEFSGPEAAHSGLFDGAVNIYCDPEQSDQRAKETAKQIFDTLGMKTMYMKSVNHDEHVAYVSHISHISSFALALTVLEKEKNEKNILALAAGGFESTVRLAKSSAQMWTPIFTDNKAQLLEVIDTYSEVLASFKKAIQQSDRDALNGMITQANSIQEVLAPMSLKHISKTKS